MNALKLVSDGLTPQAFAELHEMTVDEVVYCCKHGYVLGAKQHVLSKHWRIYPPAKLMRRPRPKKRSTKCQTVKPAPLLAVDFGTSPHGLSAECCRPHQETRQAVEPSAAPLLVDGVEALQAVAAPGAESRAVAPAVFREALASARSVAVCGGQRAYSVLLAGHQLILLEKLLRQESDSIEVRLELYEFEVEAFASFENELTAVKAVQKILRTVVDEVHGGEL